MLDLRRAPVHPDEKREQLFTQRYESLLAWAMRLTNQQREAAEDLVQDAFVQFMLSRTRLEEIENIDGYLRRMLRYMHVSRMSRSAQHLHETALSVADYDSFRLGWSAIEPPRRMQASEELYQICLYACSRKESSRAGSVLILRFFHDYFPTEIAKVLNSSRDCVDQWQRLARREAKLFIKQPGRLRFVDAKAKAERQVTYLRSDCDLMLELRQMIFKSCSGECLPREEFAQLYAEGQAEGLATRKLAHIVSCPQCLDRANSVLGLPALAHRYPAEPNHSDEPPDDLPPGGTSGGGPGDLAQKFRRRLQETREHKPHELRIAVNGFLVSSMKVSSELSELNLNLTPDEPVEFVELSSEQGVQLLFFSIDPASAQSEQWAWIELSEGRHLEACFRNDNGPSLQIVYRDPASEEAVSFEETSSIKNLSSPLFVVPSPEVSETQSQGLITRFGTWAKSVLQKNNSESGYALQEDSELQFFRSLDDRRSKGIISSWRLGFLVILISAAIVAGFFVFKSRLAPTLSATNLLEQAEAAELASYQTPDTVKHRLINLEERRSEGGAIVSRRKIEIWKNPTTGAGAQRLYDESDRLVAASWRRPDGSRVVYHHGSKPRSVPALETPQALLLNFEDIWQAELTAQSYRAFVSDPRFAEVEEHTTTYVLNYEQTRTIGASRLLKATLTLSKSDLHPIEQTLLVQRGNELREYRFVEASFELLPLKAVAPKVFEVESDLTGGTAEPGRPGEWALRDLTSSRVPPSPSTSAPPVASAELEVDVAYLLNQAKADRSEQVALTRSAGGSLRVEGIVESQERKNEFLRALAPVLDNPAVIIDIRTVAEAMKGLPASKSTSVQEIEETANTVAADEELRRYFLRRDPAGSTDEAIRVYSSEVVNRAYRALFHAIELKRLVNRFANVDMKTLAPDARAKWLNMLSQHASALERESMLLRQQIQPIFFSQSSIQVDEEAVLTNDGDLARAVERLHKLTFFNNDAIRSAFTISTHSSDVTIKSIQFARSLAASEKLAARIGQYDK